MGTGFVFSSENPIHSTFKTNKRGDRERTAYRFVSLGIVKLMVVKFERLTKAESVVMQLRGFGGGGGFRWKTLSLLLFKKQEQRRKKKQKRRQYNYPTNVWTTKKKIMIIINQM